MEFLIITICRATIDAFKASWPCHGIPADADAIVIAVEMSPTESWHLVDLDMEDSDGVTIDPETLEWGCTWHDAGSALSELVGLAIRGHKTQAMEPGTIASTHRSY